MVLFPFSSPGGNFDSVVLSVRRGCSRDQFLEVAMPKRKGDCLSLNGLLLMQCI